MNEQTEWKKRELTKPLTFSTVFRSLLIQYKIDFIYISTNANATNSLLLPSFRFYLLTSAYFIRCARAISFVLFSSTSILCAMVVVVFSWVIFFVSLFLSRFLDLFVVIFVFFLSSLVVVVFFVVKNGAYTKTISPQNNILELVSSLFYGNDDDPDSMFDYTLHPYNTYTRKR